MLFKRIISCLDIKNGRTVKGTHFVDLLDAGDAIELATKYCKEGADELVFLDITATNERRGTVADFAAKVGEVLTIPFTIGGGVRTVNDARNVLHAGADKIAVNSAAVARPRLITELAEAFGQQAVVVSVDAKWVETDWFVFTHGGQTNTGLRVASWVSQVQTLGAGEILLTSIDADGTRAGFDLPLYKAIRPLCHVPLIASGGGGTTADFVALFEQNLADGGLAASIFHQGILPIPTLKKELIAHSLPIRP